MIIAAVSPGLVCCASRLLSWCMQCLMSSSSEVVEGRPSWCQYGNGVTYTPGYGRIQDHEHRLTPILPSMLTIKGPMPSL